MHLGELDTVSVSVPPAGGTRADLLALVHGVAPLILSVGLLNVSNYAFHVVVTHLLAPAAYGGLSGLLAFLLVVSVPCGVVQTVVAKRAAMLRVVAGNPGQLDIFAAGATRALAHIGVVAAGALVVASPIVAAVLHIGVLPSLLLAPFAFLALAACVPLGILQGAKRFSGLGWTMTAGVLARFVVGVGLVYAGWGIAGALIGSVLAQVLVLAISVRLVRLPGSAWRAGVASLGGARGEMASALATLTGFWLLAEADLILARHFLGANESGVYAAAGILARAVLFLPATISLVALPHFAEARRDRERSRRWLHLALAATGVLAFGAALILVVFGRPLLSLTFGAQYAIGANVLAFLAPAMACLALTYVLLYFHIAAGSKAYVLVLIALAMEIVLILLWHGTGEDIALATLGIGGVVTALLWHASHAILRWQPDRPPEPTVLLTEDIGPSPESEPELSIVLPCHNAGRSLRAVLDQLLRATDGVHREVIVVSDGSTDDTVEIASEYPSETVSVLSYPQHAGKGQALRVGLAWSRGDYVAFIDADGDIDPGAFVPFLSIVRHYQPDIVLGSKRHPLSQIDYPPLRRMMSWVYHKLTRILFRVNVRDTQTGLKMIRHDVLRAVLPRMLEKRYAFDLEFLVVARSLGFRRVFEAPVRIDYKFESQVDPKAAWDILVDTCAIFYRRYVLGTYANVLTQGSFIDAQVRASQARLATRIPAGGAS